MAVQFNCQPFLDVIPMRTQPLRDMRVTKRVLAEPVATPTAIPKVGNSFIKSRCDLCVNDPLLFFDSHPLAWTVCLSLAHRCCAIQLITCSCRSTIKRLKSSRVSSRSASFRPKSW